MLGLLFTHGEWATGLAAAAIAALLVAVAYLAGTLVRAGAADRKGTTLRLGLAATVIFGLLGGVGLYFSGWLHQAQAGVMASVGDYSGAVHEYQLAGDGPPDANMARAYVGWGNELLRTGDDAGAAGAFQTVVEQYTGIPSVRDAGLGLLQADKGWLAAGGSSLPYLTILRDLGSVRSAAYCDSGCVAQVAALSAQAFVDYGIVLNEQGHVSQAIGQFEAVTRLYPASAAAATAHEDAAVTYYVLGQSQRNGKVCTDAVPTFQQLASAYGDTSEGTAAKTALAAPVQVTGSLTGYPKNPAPFVYLSKTIHGDSYFSDDYAASVGANGKFTFGGVVPGNYNLSAAVPNGSGVYWIDPTTHNPYSITVGPLCTLPLQSYAYA
jgi:tetratricopeptide (TPR) repeat protein